MRNKLKQLWEDAQKVIDLHGDTWLGMFTALVLLRILLVLSGHTPLTMSEATAYSSAVGAFAYSNRGPK